MQRTAVPRNVERSLYQEAESKCPKCGEANVMALTIHHIIAYAEACAHNPDAMIVLCANCHAKADRREITEDELFQLKRALRAKQVSLAARGPDGSAKSSPSFHIGLQEATHIINIAGDGTTVMSPKSRRTTVVVAPQPGSISDTQLREINDQAAKIEKESSGKTKVGLILKRIKDTRHLTALRNLPASEFPLVMSDLRIWKWAGRSKKPAREERARLIRELHAKAGNIGWSHDTLSLKCREWYGYSVRDLSLNLLKDATSRLARIAEDT